MHEYIPDLLVEFMLSHPAVNLRLQELPGNEVVAALAAGQAEVGIVRANTDVFELETFAFKPDRLVLVTPPGHPLLAAGQGGELALEQADDCDVIGLPQGTALQDIWDGLPGGGWGLEPPRGGADRCRTGADGACTPGARPGRPVASGARGAGAWPQGTPDDPGHLGRWPEARA